MSSQEEKKGTGKTGAVLDQMRKHRVGREAEDVYGMLMTRNLFPIAGVFLHFFCLCAILYASFLFLERLLPAPQCFSYCYGSQQGECCFLKFPVLLRVFVWLALVYVGSFLSTYFTTSRCFQRSAFLSALFLVTVFVFLVLLRVHLLAVSILVLSVAFLMFYGYRAAIRVNPSRLCEDPERTE